MPGFKLVLWVMIGIIITVSHADPIQGTSGTCSWTFDEATGYFEIKPTNGMSGQMSTVRWAEYKKLIKRAKIGTGTSNIVKEAFSDCTELTYVTVPKMSLTTIEENAFKNCAKLTKTEVSGFSKDYSTIPSSVTTIEQGAFDGCTSLILTTENGASYIGSALYGSTTTNPYFALLKADKTITSYEINAKTVIIVDKVFKDFTELTSVTLPNSVTTIGASAFEGCSNLESLSLGNSVTTIGKDAFKGCSKIGLTEDGVLYLGSSDSPHLLMLSADPSITTCVIPEDTKIVADTSFDGCDKLRSIVFGKSVTAVGTKVFDNLPALESITITTKNMQRNYRNIFPVDRIKNVVFTGEIDSISDSTFEGCSALETLDVQVPNVRYIGKNAFYGCSSLKWVKFPLTYTEIRPAAFALCDKLENFTIPSGVTSIPMSAFMGCGSLKSVELEEGITSIGNNAFERCSSLESITIPKTVTSIGTSAFDFCTNLKSVTIEEGVQSIGYYAFDYCKKLSSVTIPESIVNISSFAFEHCSSLKTVNYLGTKDPGKNAVDVFYGCKELEKINVPDGYEDTQFCGSKTGVIERKVSTASLNSKPTKWFITIAAIFMFMFL